MQLKGPILPDYDNGTVTPEDQQQYINGRLDGKKLYCKIYFLGILLEQNFFFLLNTLLIIQFLSYLKEKC